MSPTDSLFAFYYAFSFSAIVSFARLFTSRCKTAFYERSRKTIIYKWKYILSGRSRCDHCNHVLGPVFVIPIAGFLFSGGKCRHCGQKISGVYLFEESLAFLYGIFYFISARNHVDHYHMSTIFMIFYVLLCYFISNIDREYFLIPTEALWVFFLVTVTEKIAAGFNENIPAIAAVAVSWFALLHLLNYLMPGKLGLADIHLVVVLSLAAGFPHSLYLPTVASFMAVVYFFIRHRKESWSTARTLKIPFGLFLCLAFVLLKMIPF